MKFHFSILLFFIATPSIHAQDAFKEYIQPIPGSSQFFKMTPIEGGQFKIGNLYSKNKDEIAVKEIKISSFWMSTFEVTRDALDTYLKDEQTSQNQLYDAITRPSPQYVDLTWGMGKEGGYPANSMSQYTAIMYCKWLYEKTNIFYRLPTEAEWEYACKAGSQSTYFFGADSSLLDKYAWFEKNSDDKFHKVGQKLPNAWGLYDMLGNLAEWTLDHYFEDAYTHYTSKDPIVDANTKRYPKVVRGGSFMDDASKLTSTKRNFSTPLWNNRDPQVPKSRWWLTEGKNIGIRLVRPFNVPSKEAIEQFFKTYLYL